MTWIVDMTGGGEMWKRVVCYGALLAAGAVALQWLDYQRLARIAQPFFRRPGGGTRIPIRISGPRSNPAFGLDSRRVFNRG